MSALEFEKLLPRHEASLHLTHNQHKAYYETVADYIADVEEHSKGATDWVCEGERERAIAANELWHLQWYPDTPVGFCDVYAASFAALVAYLEAREK